MQGVDADEIAPKLTAVHSDPLQTLFDDVCRETGALERARAGVGNLALTDIPIAVADRHFQCGRPRPAGRAVDRHAIRSNLRHAHAAEIRDRVRRFVRGRIVNLVQQLLLARRRGHASARSRHLGDDDRTVLGYFSKRKAETAQIVDVLVPRVGEIAARDLSRALEQMASERATPQIRPRIESPAERVRLRRDKQRRIRRATGDDDVGSSCQRFDDRLGADVRVRGNQAMAQRRDALAALGDRVVSARDEIEHIVAADDGDREVADAETPGHILDDVRRSNRVGGAHVRDDSGVARHTCRQHRFHAIGKQRIRSRARIASLCLLRQRNGALGETLEHEVVEVAAGRELDSRLDTIARESGAAADADRLHSAKTPSTTHVTVMSTDAANRNGPVYRWCSPSSMPLSPTTRNVAGVNGLTGNPVVI